MNSSGVLQGEYVWDAETQYELQYEAQRNELTKRLAIAKNQELDALARLDGATLAKVILSSTSSGDLHYPPRCFDESRYMPFHPAWYCYRDDWSGIVTVRSYWAQPGHRFIQPYQWFTIKEWTDEKVEKTISGLVEVKSRSFADSFEYSYTANIFGYQARVRIDYTYEEREERYALSETALTGLQAELKEQMAEVSTETRHILSDLYDELCGVVKPLIRQGVWFKPELKPSPWKGKISPELDLGIDTSEMRSRKAKELVTGWPLLARYPQPAIGEKRSITGWARHGAWVVREFPRALDWLGRVQKALRLLCEQRKDQLRASEEQAGRIKQQLDELIAKDRQIRQQSMPRSGSVSEETTGAAASAATYTMGNGRVYAFSFEYQLDGSIRAYILKQPDYGAQDASLLTTHRVKDSEGRLSIAWNKSLLTRGEVIKVAEQWARQTEQYITTGKPFEL